MKCTARKSNGIDCRAWAIKGAKVCRVHGGRAPQVAAAAAVRVIEEKARRAVRGVAITPVTDPLSALQQVVGEILAFKDFLANQVEFMNELVSHDDKGAEQIRAIIGAYERGLDRSATWLTAIARLDIDERLARVTEAQQLMVVRAIEAALASVGVAGPEAQRAKRVAASHLRLVGAA